MAALGGRTAGAGEEGRSGGRRWLVAGAKISVPPSLSARWRTPPGRRGNPWIQGLEGEILRRPQNVLRADRVIGFAMAKNFACTPYAAVIFQFGAFYGVC